MTILIDPVLAGSLATSGTSNNPVIAWDNKFNDATSVVTTAGTDVEPPTLAGDIGTYNAWVCTPNVFSAATFELTFASPVTFDFVGLAAHNLGTINASVTIEYFDGGWQDVGSGPAIPVDNQAIGFYFDAKTSDQWRVRVNNVSQNVQIGIASFSTALTLDQRIFQGYAPPLTPNVVDLQTNVSEGANLLGVASVARGSVVEASVTLLDGAYIRSSDWLNFQRHFNNGAPFFWAWRPTQYNDLFYAWRPQSAATIAPDNSGPKDRMSLTMGMRFYDNP